MRLSVANDGLNTHAYTYIDVLAAPQHLFYCLRAVDFDQKYQYSPAIAVPGNNAAALRLQPNPATVHTDIFVNHLVHLQIFDPTGLLILDNRRQKESCV